MKKFVVLILLSFAIAAVASAAGMLEFSADVINKSKSGVMTSKLYMKDKKMRMDMPGQDMYNITRQDKKLTWTVMPSQKMYMEMAFQEPRDIPERKVAGEVSRKLVGRETIDGHPTEKYEVTYTDADKQQRMYQWMATDINFPVKMAAIDGSWSMEYRNIKMGPPADALFEIPSGFKKMTLPTMPGAGFGKGMAPGKIPKNMPLPDVDE